MGQAGILPGAEVTAAHVPAIQVCKSTSTAIPTTKDDGGRGRQTSITQGCSISLLLTGVASTLSSRETVGFRISHDARHCSVTFMVLTQEDTTPLVVFFPHRLSCKSNFYFNKSP